jgi:hypothetical protein
MANLLITTYGIFWPLFCLFFFDLHLLITTYGIFWPLFCLFFFDLRLLITTYGKLEGVNQRRTDKTMAKRKRTKEQTMI